MLHIEGEKEILKNHGDCFEFQLPREPDVVFPTLLSEDSWTLESVQSQRRAPLPDDDESGGEEQDERATGVLRYFNVSEEGESFGGRDMEGASNNRDGDSSPMASINPFPMTKMQALLLQQRSHLQAKTPAKTA